MNVFCLTKIVNIEADCLAIALSCLLMTFDEVRVDNSIQNCLAIRHSIFFFLKIRDITKLGYCYSETKKIVRS